MKVRHKLNTIVSSIGLVLSFAGCAAHDANLDHSKAAAAAQALTVIDCQTQAVECLRSATTRDAINACQTALQDCTAPFVQEAEAQAKAIAQCTQSAIKCASSASTTDAAATCRTDFETCTGGMIDLPSPASLPVPPEVGPALKAADACRQTALSCVSSAASSEDVAACAKAFQGCVAEAVPALKLPDVPAPDLTALKAAGACRDTARACISDAQSAADVDACRDAFTSCISDLVGSLPPLPDPKLALQCAKGLGDCLKAGTAPAECASQARDCAGLQP